MVAKYVSCTKLLQNIIIPCSWLKGKCTVTILNESMYCHWKVLGGTCWHKPYFQRLSLPFSALISQSCGLQEPLMLTRALENCKDEGSQVWWGGRTLLLQLVWRCCWWDSQCRGLLPPLAFDTVVQWFLKSMWPMSPDASAGIISKPASPGFLWRMLDVCAWRSRRSPRNFTESGERQLKRDMGSSPAFDNPWLSHLAPGLSPELLIQQLKIASLQGLRLPEKTG